MGSMMVIFVILGLCSQAAADSSFSVSVFSSTSKTAILRWTRYSGATSYKISAVPVNSPTTDTVSVTYGPNTVMGSITFLSADVEYTFTVEALDGSQILSSTSTDSSTAPDKMDPIQTVKSLDSQTLVAEFNLKPRVSGYVIRIQNNEGFFREEAVSSSPALITSLSPYTEYTLSIMAENSAGRSQPSTPLTAKTVLPAPVPSSSSPSNESIIVSWAPVAHAVQYTVSIHKFSSNSQIEHNTSDTSLTISGLDAGSLYNIKAFAWDPEGREGDRSSYIDQTTRPPTPSSVNVSMNMHNGVTGLSVTWEMPQEVYGVVEYHVVSDQNLSCNATSSTSCSLSPVVCGQVHIIQITASNEAGPSYPSNAELFITFPCPPDSLSLTEFSDGNCTVTWNTVPYADSYVAFIKKGDGNEDTCNTTNNNCTYECRCGYTYIMSVLAFNQAGRSPQGEALNLTTLPCCPEEVSVSAVSTDTLEITWAASRGAEVYETRAADGSEVVLCNDTAPVCALSDLSCDSTYSVVVTPCSDISGCNRACKAHNKDTAPCTPNNLVLSPINASSVSVSWTANNRAATYTVTATGDDEQHTCSSNGSSCDITDLPCGSTYEVSVTAASAAGHSLSSFTDSIETEPCCPLNLTVQQVTQAMTNVSWSVAKGAHSFVTSLTSPRGHARCHTQDSHCLMGCITCGTSYSVTMEAFSHSGRSSNCSYQGFSSSACCPTGVRLLRLANNSLRVYWRSGGSGSHTSVADIMGSNNNYTCTAAPGENQCNVGNIQCGDVYHVVVAPLTSEGNKVLFCPQRLYSVTCTGSSVGTVVYRGKRSVD